MGVTTVRNRGLGCYDLYDSLEPQFLRHLLDTNEVFLMVANGLPWEQLPFVRVGSHRSRFTFVELVVDQRGGVSHPRDRQLAPDAIITPTGDPSVPRCFLELDRSTETIVAGHRRNSIEYKLRTYNALIHQFIPGETRSAYDVAFRHSRRPARLVFVVAKEDDQRRRIASIWKKAHEVVPRLDVRVLALSDVAGIRAAVLPPTTAMHGATPQLAPRKLREITLNQVLELRDAFVDAVPHLKVAAHANPACCRSLNRLGYACRQLALRAKDSLGSSDERNGERRSGHG